MYGGTADLKLESEPLDNDEEKKQNYFISDSKGY